jgi:hypothetical protein
MLLLILVITVIIVTNILHGIKLTQRGLYPVVSLTNFRIHEMYYVMLTYAHLCRNPVQ